MRSGGIHGVHSKRRQYSSCVLWGDSQLVPGVALGSLVLRFQWSSDASNRIACAVLRYPIVPQRLLPFARFVRGADGSVIIPLRCVLRAGILIAEQRMLRTCGIASPCITVRHDAAQSGI